MTLSNEVEGNEAYMFVVHKGQPEIVKSKKRQDRRCQLKDKSDRSTMEKDGPPVFGRFELGRQVVLVCWTM